MIKLHKISPQFKTSVSERRKDKGKIKKILVIDDSLCEALVEVYTTELFIQQIWHLKEFAPYLNMKVFCFYFEQFDKWMGPPEKKVDLEGINFTILNIYLE